MPGDTMQRGASMQPETNSNNKSYKYKRRRRRWRIKSAAAVIEPTSCDQREEIVPHPRYTTAGCGPWLSKKRKAEHKSRRRKNEGAIVARVYPSRQPFATLILVIISLLLLLQRQPPVADAFCPLRCQCDDLSLSANCTQVSSINIIPMTLNPLLKRLTLNQLPMAELSNSLSVYRQLETLNLSSNELRQIKYENFNFKPKPSGSISLIQPSTGHPMHNPSAGNLQQPPGDGANTREHLELGNQHNELWARHLRQSIDKSLSSSEDEIRFHLRELDLSDNKIDQLGSLSEEDEQQDSASGHWPGDPSQQQLAAGGNRRLKSHELQRLAPFLTLTKLELLSLAGNKLVRLHQHVFLGLVHLKRLDLSRNHLTVIDRYALVGLIELTHLNLADNFLARHLPALSLALCRAPMIELRQLDLSDNSPNDHTRSLGKMHYSQQQPHVSSTEQHIPLPNQMFICAPKLRELRLDGLQLRYIQANAFDNLHQLASLNLGRNLLEQVPSDALGSYSNSNLSQTLEQLDLSDNPIEFVNANSFNWLKNLKILRMNSMSRLVSFDLASLSFNHLIGERPAARYLQSPQQPPSVVEDEQLAATMMMMINSQQLVHELINDQLIELHLRDAPRLQALHSSLATRTEQPRGKMKFRALRLLDLSGSIELREFPLDQMMDLSELIGDNLLLDLSHANKLNCSSCQLSWLVDAARSSWPHIAPPTQTQAIGAGSGGGGSKVSLVSNSIGCAMPFAMPLVQLLQLDTSYAPIFASHCQLQHVVVGEEQAQSRQVLDHRQQAGSSWRASVENNNDQATLMVANQLRQPQSWDSSRSLSAPTLRSSTAVATTSSVGMDYSLVASGALLVAALIALAAKLVARSTWLKGRRSYGSADSAFKWRAASSATTTNSPTTSIESPSASSTTMQPHPAGQQQHPSSTSGADCSAADERQLADLFAAKQQQQQQQTLLLASGDRRLILARGLEFGGQMERRGNLFSRVVERLSAFAWQRSRNHPLEDSATYAGADSCLGEHLRTQQHRANIIENVVYGGDKISANLGHHLRHQQLQLASGAVNQSPGACNYLIGGPLEAEAVGGEQVYANYDQQLWPPISDAAASAGQHQLSAREPTSCRRPMWTPDNNNKQLLEAIEMERNLVSIRQQQQQQHQWLPNKSTCQAAALSREQDLTLVARQRYPQSSSPPYNTTTTTTDNNSGCNKDEAGANSLDQRQLYLAANCDRARWPPPLASLESHRRAGLQPRPAEQSLGDGHIYVTLDGPIKQRQLLELQPDMSGNENGYDECCLHFDSELHADGPPQQQRHQHQLRHHSGTGQPDRPAEEYKSFEWSARRADAPSSCDMRDPKPLKMLDKFKLANYGSGQYDRAAQQQQQLADLDGKLSLSGMPIERKKSAPLGGESTAGLSPYGSGGQVEIYGRDDLAAASAGNCHGKQSAVKSTKENANMKKKKKRKERATAGCRNVTGQSDHHEPRSGGQIEPTADPRTLPQQLFGQGPASGWQTNSTTGEPSAKYDANHGAQLAAAVASGSLASSGGRSRSSGGSHSSASGRESPSGGDDDDDYVINGLPATGNCPAKPATCTRSNEPVAQPLATTGHATSHSSRRHHRHHHEPGEMGGASAASGCSVQTKWNGFGIGPSDNNNVKVDSVINEASTIMIGQRDFVAAGSGAQNSIACREQQSGNSCDYLMDGQQKQVRSPPPEANGGRPISVVVGAGRASAGQQIYSNQFYYCKPAASSTTAATLSRIKSNSNPPQS